METNPETQNLSNTTSSANEPNKKLSSEGKNITANEAQKLSWNQLGSYTKERNIKKIKGQRYSADLDLIKNNLIEKNFNLSNENSKNLIGLNEGSGILNTESTQPSSLKGEKIKAKISDNYLSEAGTSQKIKITQNLNSNSALSNLSQSINFSSNSSTNISLAYKLSKTNSNIDKISAVVNLKPEDLLKKVFLVSKNAQLLSVIMNIKEIEKLLLYLLHCKNENYKIQIIEFLKQNFCDVPHNIDIFNQIYIDVLDEETNEYEKFNLYNILFSFINNPENNFENKKEFINLVLTLLEIMAIQSNCMKQTFEAVFQEFSKLFKSCENSRVCPHKGDFLGTKSNSTEHQRVSLIIKKNISILKVLYSKFFDIEKPNNYLYFNGQDYLRVREKALTEEKILLKEGLSMLFWLKIDFQTLKELNLEASLINMKCQQKDKHFNINIIVKENQILIKNNNMYSNSKEAKMCQHDHDFIKNNTQHNYYKSSDWTFIGITIKKHKKTPIIKLYINGTSNEYNSDVIDLESEITEISLFNKFCGLATSFILFEGVLDEKQMDLIKEHQKGSEKYFGFYSENKLTKFLRKINPKHLENSDFEKYYDIINNSSDLNGKNNNSALSNKHNNTNSLSNPNFEILKDAIGKNLKIFYTPMRKKDRTLYDLTNTYHANFANYESLGFGVCGIRSFYNFQKNIFLLGGINNIIPIVELMWLSNTYKENFVDFMELISQILFEREKNMKDAIEKKFFQILSIFIEKFDMEIFDSRLLNIFKDLLKHFFQCVGKNELCKIFLENILLNVKILLKFEINLQIEIWRTLYQCYVSDPTEINRFMNIKKLSSIVSQKFNIIMIHIYSRISLNFIYLFLYVY